MKKILILSCALALAGLSNAALAAPPKDTAVFLRVEAGHSDIDLEGDFDDSDSTSSLRGGYYFTPNFAVEGFFGTLYDGRFLGLNGEVEAYGIGGIAKKNFGANNTGFFINGRAGVLRANTTFDDGIGEFRDDTTEPYVGVGLGYDFTRAFGLSANYDWVQTDVDGLDLDVETITLGAEYRF